MITFIIPSIFLIFLAFILPIVRYTWISLHSLGVTTSFIAIPNNFSNWVRLFNDDRFWIDAIQTVRFTSVSVFFEILLAISIALILNGKFKHRNIIRTLIILPWALPTTVMALGWRWIYNSPYGLIHRIISLVGFENINILADPKITWLAGVLADTWKTTPFISIILLAGLQTIPQDIYEAYKLEGGSNFNSFFNMTLPLIEPYLLLTILFRSSQAFGVFELIQVLSGGGPAGSTESLGYYAYINAMRFLDFGYSSTIIIASFVLLVFYCFLIIAIFNVVKKNIYSQLILEINNFYYFLEIDIYYVLLCILTKNFE